MYACGLRISEATTLEIKAIDGPNFRLRIIGKGDRERLVPLPRPVLDDLRLFWKTHRNPRWLFPNHSGAKPVDPQVLAPLFSKKRFARQSNGDCRTYFPTRRFAPSLAA